MFFQVNETSYGKFESKVELFYTKITEQAGGGRGLAVLADGHLVRAPLIPWGEAHKDMCVVTTGRRLPPPFFYV